MNRLGDLERLMSLRQTRERQVAEAVSRARSELEDLIGRKQAVADRIRRHLDRQEQRDASFLGAMLDRPATSADLTRMRDAVSALDLEREALETDARLAEESCVRSAGRLKELEIDLHARRKDCERMQVFLTSLKRQGALKAAVLAEIESEESWRPAGGAPFC